MVFGKKHFGRFMVPSFPEIRGNTVSFSRGSGQLGSMIHDNGTDGTVDQKFCRKLADLHVLAAGSLLWKSRPGSFFSLTCRSVTFRNIQWVCRQNRTLSRPNRFYLERPVNQRGSVWMSLCEVADSSGRKHAACLTVDPLTQISGRPTDFSL